jgi:hypothetical protein
VGEGYYYDDDDPASGAFDQGFEEGREQAIPRHGLGERLAEIEEELEDDYEDRAFDLGEEIYNDQVATEAEQAVIEADEDVFDQGLDLVEQMIGRELTGAEVDGIDQMLDMAAEEDIYIEDPRQIASLVYKSFGHRMSPEEHKRARRLYADGVYEYATGGRRARNPGSPVTDESGPYALTNHFEPENSSPLQPPLNRDGEEAIKDLRPKDRKLGPIE